MRQIVRQAFRVIIIGLITALMASYSLPSRAQEFIKPDPIEQFDGKTWGGLTIGQSTTDDIKRMYKTSRGAIRPEAMLLPQPEPSKVRIDVLMHGRGGTSTLQGFRIAYADGAPTLRDLSDSLKTEPQMFYPQRRFDEQQLAAFPERGVIAFLAGSGRLARIEVILLCSPGRMHDAVTECRAAPTPILNVRDEFPTDRLVLEIGKIRVDISTVKGMAIKDKSDVEDDLQRRIKRQRTPREVDIVDRSAGTLNIDVTVTLKDRRAKIEAKATISGKTLLGAVSVSGDGSDAIREDGDNPIWRGGRNLENAVSDAVDRAYRRASEKVRSQKPPTPDELRLLDWNARISRATP